jgi:acyl-homoserine lactone acylase PvdQ
VPKHPSPAKSRKASAIARGAAGDPASPHFADLEQNWKEGSYQPLLFRDSDVSGAAIESKLTLEVK